MWNSSHFVILSLIGGFFFMSKIIVMITSFLLHVELVVMVYIFVLKYVRIMVCSDNSILMWFGKVKFCSDLKKKL